MAASSELLESLEREASRTLSLWRRLTAPQLLATSFLILVAFGTALLLALPGLYTGERLSFVDALFTATSAVCVTGLAVVDTGTFFTPFGQGVLLFLVQLGGLGILTFTTVVILWLGGRITLRSEAVVGGLDTGPPIDAARLLRGAYATPSASRPSEHSSSGSRGSGISDPSTRSGPPSSTRSMRSATQGSRSSAIASSDSRADRSRSP